MSSIDFEEFAQINNELLNNAELFNKTARTNKHFRLNVKRTSVLERRTPRPNSITLTPRELEDAVKDKYQPTTPAGGYDVSLPKLSATRKERRKIDRTYLYQWLNSALEEAGGKGPLRGVKKYQVDKRHLLGQNIPIEYIDKLYHSLYIYSYGFRKVLADMLNENEVMIIKFWRVFLKLIEQTSEYDNLFAVVERKHNENIEDLRKTILRKDQYIDKLKVQSEDRLRELTRDVNSKIEEIKDLKVEKFVLESNFELTDEAFNDEVALRLRFEEKINSINTAYNELKTKYSRLVEDLKVHREGTQSHYEKEKEHINEKGNYEMRILEQEKLVSIERERLKLKDKEIGEIRQELFDLNQEKLAKVRKDDEEEVELKTALIRERKINMKLAEETDKLEAAEKVIENQSAEIKKLTSDLYRTRKSLYYEYMVSYQLRQDISYHKKELEEKTSRMHTLEIVAEQRRKELDTLASLTYKQQYTIANLEKELEYNKKRVSMLDYSLALNQKTIEGLRDSKDKHEKLFKIIESEQAETLKALNEANKKVFELEEEKKGFLIMLETKEHSNSYNESRLRTDLDIARNKIQAQASQLGNKDNMILRSNDKIDEMKNVIVDKNFQVDKLQKNVFDLQNSLSKETFERKLFEGKCKQLEDAVRNHKQEIEKLNGVVLTLKKNNAALSTDKSTLSYVIDEKKKLTEAEAEAIKGLLKSYKEQLEALTQNIHPMHYWDKEAQVNRLQEKINPLLVNLAKLKELIKMKEEEGANGQTELLKMKRLVSEERTKSDNAESEIASLKGQLAKSQEQHKGATREIYRLKQYIYTRNSRITEYIKRMDELSIVIQQAKAKKDAMRTVYSQTTVKTFSEESVQVDIEIRVNTSSKHSQGSDRRLSRDEERRQETHLSTKPVEQTKPVEAPVELFQKKQSHPKNEVQEPPKYIVQAEEETIAPEEPLEETMKPQNLDTPHYEQPNQQERPPRPPIPPAKPVTNKQFSKALKFTFMRK